MKIQDILQRVGEIIGSDKNIAIAKALQVAPQTSSTWKTRQTIPWKELYVFCNKRGVSMEWLLTGEGQPWADATAPQPGAEERDERILAVQRLLDLLEAEPEYAEAATAAISLIRRIKDLEHRVRELEEEYPPRQAKKDEAEDVEAG